MNELELNSEHKTNFVKRNPSRYGLFFLWLLWRGRVGRFCHFETFWIHTWFFICFIVVDSWWIAYDAQSLGHKIQYQQSKDFPECTVVLLLTKSENHFFSHGRLFLLS